MAEDGNTNVHLLSTAFTPYLKIHVCGTLGGGALNVKGGLWLKKIDNNHLIIQYFIQLLSHQ